MYHNIPMELRERRQWVCWRYERTQPTPEYPEGRITKVPYSANGTTHASVTDPSTWADFDTVVNASRASNLNGIGFVLTNGDPYCIIDLDNKAENPIDAEEWRVHERILNAFPSYTERSVSGRGYHIVIRGKLPAGRRRGNVEVYSGERYMCFTGDVVRNAPIIDAQGTLEALVESMPSSGASVELHDVEGVLTDQELLDMATNAANGAKYVELCKGDWKAMGYTSQSDADFALLSMLAFYSRDNEQVRRMFRYSGLGRRDKATKDNVYLNRSLAKIRANQATPTDFEQAKRNVAAMVAASAPPMPDGGPLVTHAAALAAPAPPTPTAPPPPVPAQAPTRAQAGTYTLPPGLVGELASYFYSTAIRTAPEAALAAAIGIVAGVAGRSYNVSNTGLNHYILLVAKTGTGKESMESGITKLIAATRPTIPMIEEFIGPSAFASGQGLIKTLDARPCFVSILGEFGLTLQAMNDPRAPSATILLRKVLLDLHSKSGWQSVLRSTAYSDSEKNTKMIHAPNVTILAETTPETFYDTIDAGDIADGLIPRFHIIEYKGSRPKRNRNAGFAPDAGLVQRFGNLAAVAITMSNNQTCASVQLAPEAATLMDEYDETCDGHMRQAHNEAETQIWNRAHLKALRLAALLAVGVNPHAPTITAELAQWAIDFTNRGAAGILSRFETGDIGTGEQKQGAELRRMVKEYFTYSPQQVISYKGKPEQQKAGVVPYAYLTVRASRLACFNKDRLGTARALQNAINELVASEVLGQVTPLEAQQKFQSKQALYYLGANW